ncbi:MAG: CDP-2,3-bis-(O-geranylgeranyl)-sn-glycerol synthase [Thermoplasmata archaeon]|uniref:CDP-2,3-bis-(O-geranylgeranyl)-sn-glycerol synthase n=1 Tax=Candidatus Sysuiplasma superficiale TaxID=2823368 RepID=A0A8J7YR36_9ARCH|nr:CDP-2,3-bis-(O-geranylgeranyl)-sn-glycerol synthase [Candidatus Sysuiplasma superficiale]MBX8643651.1 CDP-2,3-bis-(O-geranylgeranyl)-sn-glycerol synthase [Candidatus Sysuiplasma superficiale]
MLPNTGAAIFGGGMPVDFGRMWKSRRILGDGKTWRGLAVGIMSGVLLGYAESIIGTLFASPASVVYIPSATILPVLLALSAGSMFGDMGGAFVKRRMGLEKGAHVPVLDQYDFAAGAFLLSLIVAPSYVFRFLLTGYAPVGFAVALAMIYPLHRLINYIGYRQGLKSVPW